MNQIEQWKKVAGFETYSVSDRGNVRNDKTGRILKPGTSSNGYLSVVLRKQKKSCPKNIHRIVASAFLPNPNKKKLVDHIDNNETNNKLINLRWATTSENAQNAKLSTKNTSGTKGVHYVKKTNKRAAQICINGKQINLGSFMNKEDAVNIRIQRAKDEFGEYLNACEIILNV